MVYIVASMVCVVASVISIIASMVYIVVSMTYIVVSIVYIVVWYILQAIWNWMDNYPTEFTDLQKRPNDELQGKRSLHLGNLYKVLCTEFPLF